MQTHSIKTAGLTQQVLEHGPQTGPLVLFIHGFPELGISWSAQVWAAGDAGYRAVAPDMRGYGGTDKPVLTEDHTILHLVGDMVDLVRALGHEGCVVVGHDWGAPVAWHCALMRPDMFKAVIGLSVPFQPRRASGPPIPTMAAMSGRPGPDGQPLGDLYILRLQAPDAHLEWDGDVEAALRRAFYGYDGATPADRKGRGFLPPGQSMLQSVPDDATLPPWMPRDHFDAYVAAFAAGGFKGPIDWYRCMDANWSLTAWLQGRTIDQPSLFMVGELDPVRQYVGQHEAGLKDWLTDLRGQVVVSGAGHWLQQERADTVNAALLGFLAEVS